LRNGHPRNLNYQVKGKSARPGEKKIKSCWLWGKKYLEKGAGGQQVVGVPIQGEKSEDSSGGVSD